MASSISSKIIRNTVYNSAGRFWGIIVSIIMTPYIISHIGIERFGLWAVVGVITSYFGLLDFGVSSSFVKYFSEFYTKKSYADINRLISTGFIFYSVLAVLIIAVAGICIEPLLSIFKVPQYLHSDARFVIMLGTILFCVSSALGIFIAVLQGAQRMDISNLIEIGASFINIGGIIFVLRNGYGIKGLMVNNVIVFAVIATLSIIVAMKIIPQIRFNLFMWSASIFRRTFAFGYKMQIAKISGMLSTQADKILIAYFLSIGLVTFYQLGSSIIYSAASLIGLLMRALLPAFSEIEAGGNKSRLVEAYLRSTKYVAFFVAPIFIFSGLSAGRIMFIWMGTGYDKAVYIIQILAFAWALNSVARVGSAISMAIEKPGLMARSSVMTMVLYITLSVILIKYLGFYGVAWGAAIAVNIGTIYFLSRLNKKLSVRLTVFAKNIAPYFLAGLLSAAIVWWSGLASRRIFGALDRAGSLLLLTVEGALFLSLYIVIVCVIRPFAREDIDLFRQKIPLVGPFLKKR